MKIVLALSLVTLANAQMYGNGFGKTTFSSSDGNGCYAWFKKHLPVTQDHPNGDLSCGDVGRVRLETSNDLATDHAWPPRPGFSHGFGLHSVHVGNSSKRVHGSCISIATVENALDAKLERVYAGGDYDAFMDFNSGHWVASLDPYVESFRKSNTPVVLLAWRDSVNREDYFSLITRVHTSMMFVELMSADCSACSSAIRSPTARYFFAEGKNPGAVFGPLDDKTAQKPVMHPAKISWPTSNATREREYLANGLGASVASHVFDGVTTDVYDFSPVQASATMQFHVVERPANGSTGPMSWADLEVAINTCHRASIKDDACGEDIWMDHHAGLAIHGSNKVHTDAETLKKLTTKLGLPFHVTPSPQGSPAVYGIAGNGLSITFQVDQGSYQPPRDLGNGMLDLCSDGNCGSYK